MNKHVLPSRGKPSSDDIEIAAQQLIKLVRRRDHPRLTPEAQRLLDALASAFEAEPHAVDFVRYLVERNAQGHINAFHAHHGILAFDPDWLLDASNALMDALRGMK